VFGAGNCSRRAKKLDIRQGSLRSELREEEL
jgi:hypothetical protein